MTFAIVEGGLYVIQRFDGREVTDRPNAPTTGMMSRGDRMESEVHGVYDQLASLLQRPGKWKNEHSTSTLKEDILYQNQPPLSQELRLHRRLLCLRADCNQCGDSMIGLSAEHLTVMQRCIRLSRLLRYLSAAWMSRMSELSERLCRLCAEVCDLCAQECDRRNGQLTPLRSLCKSVSALCRSLPPYGDGVRCIRSLSFLLNVDTR